MKFLSGKNISAMLMGCCAVMMCTQAARAESAPAGANQDPALKLNIKYYDKILTAEGMLRESRYEEVMVRRPGHVWSARVLPAMAPNPGHTDHESESGHKHFNPTVLPRHIVMQGGKMKVEFIDEVNKQLINIAETEFQDVSFDGSWLNAYYLIDPKQVLSLPVSARKSEVQGAIWHEQQKNGVFQRVLWDGKNKIPLEVETGTLNGAVYRRVSVALQPINDNDRPWKSVSKYAAREYADFLD